MTSVRMVCLCAVLICCAAPGIGWQSLDELAVQQETGYEGGLGPADLALAQALASDALASGVPRKVCPSEPADPASGVRVATLETDEAPAQGVPNPVLDALKTFIERGNRKQRDIAVVALGRIGPGSAVGTQVLSGRGAWSRMALSALTCDAWTPPDVHDLWSPERETRVSSLDYQARSALAVEWMIDQMLDRTLAWPDDVFAYALGNRGYDKGLTETQVLRLVPVLTDAAYPRSIRLQAVWFVRELKRSLPALEKALAELYGGDDADLREAAGQALIEIGSPLGADVLADRVESAEDRSSEWDPRLDCIGYGLPSERLARALLCRLEDGRQHVRAAAIRALGCLRETRAIDAMVRALDRPFWSDQEDTLEALGRMRQLPPDARAAIDRIAKQHWSARVRKAAELVLADPRPPPPEIVEIPWFFHRVAIDHGLPVCHGKEPGDGTYRLPWLGAFEVRWEDAKVHDIPSGFPLELREMRSREGYGSNTFLRVEDGWLFATDLWHYDGELGFVSDAGEVDRFAGDAADAAFILETPLGTTVLSGTLELVHRTPGGNWTMESILELPSGAYAHAFALDGTLLVKDPHGAVAITKDRRIVPLACP
jgi:hypothetical protein